MFTVKTQPKSICILRLSALGDVTHVIPVIRAIQDKWPDVSITWLCGQIEHRLLTHIEGLRFIVFDKKAGLKAYLKVWRELRGERFDIMLHMHASARANLLSLMVRAKCKLGWDDNNARDLHRFFIDKKIPSGSERHQLQGYLEFAREIGITVDEPEWKLPIPDDAVDFVNSHLPVASAILVLSPCSSHARRNWKSERYAKVADYAIDKLGMTVVLSGGASELEREMGKAIETQMMKKPVNLIGKDTLPQLMALLKRADVIVGPDSGPIHIANAVGTAAIGLYACTRSKRSGPYHSLDLCIDKYEEAANRFLNKQASDLTWNNKIELEGVMDLIEVDDVIEKLKISQINGKK